MRTSADIARELLRLFQEGRSGVEAVAELRCLFPRAGVPKLERACMIAADEAEAWAGDEIRSREDAGAAFDLMVRGAPETEISAAFQRLKLTAENVFPRQPDKSRS